MLQGFKLGADDYITKPFSMEELVSRISAILRRVRGKRDKDVTVFRIGKYTFDTQKQTLNINNKSQKLTTKESELLSLLCHNYFNARSMDVYITKLRKLIKDDPTIEIINIHGKGYKLIAPEPEE